jgi:hypothetical protein
VGDCGAGGVSPTVGGYSFVLRGGFAGKAKGKKQKEKSNTNLFLGLSIDEHLQKAKEYAMDVSEYAHLYQSSDPHFYDGIPEAAMLKRGMTEQKRIDNGYWVAYQIALALEQRLAAQR